MCDPSKNNCLNCLLSQRINYVSSKKQIYNEIQNP